jgi:hypothetical protein
MVWPWSRDSAPAGGTSVDYGRKEVQSLKIDSLLLGLYRIRPRHLREKPDIPQSCEG